MMADGSTKYLSELEMGDEVMVTSSDGTSRTSTVGRVKIERRPFILFKWKDENHNEAGALLQQAETVRLVSNSGLISITDLSPDMEIIGWSGGAGRMWE